MKLYYYFSVNDRFFTQGTKQFAKTDNTHQFYGLAGGKRDFLETDIYEHISYLSELEFKLPIDYQYLTEVEEKYNIRIADLINSERNLWRFDKDTRIRYIEAIIRRIEKDYNTHKFDIVFSEGLDDFPSYFLEMLSKKHKIPFYYFVYSRIGGSVFLSDRKDTGPIGLESFYAENRATYLEKKNSFEKTFQTIHSYINNKKQPYYVTQSQMLYKAFSLDDVKAVFQAIRTYRKDPNAYHAFENPLKFPINRYNKIKRKKEYKKYFKDKFIDFANLKNQKYFIYPLHFHPEAATLIQGRWINDQRALIEMFSKALPADVKLIVKEHKVSIGRRPISFFTEIDKLHNVHFISEDQEVYSLIENSLGVVTISSSMGIEAIMLNKPVITFGDIHYNILSQVIKARDISKMIEYVDEALNFNGYAEDEYWAFFKAVTENCYEMPGYSPHNFNDEHVHTFVDMLKGVFRH